MSDFPKWAPASTRMSDLTAERDWYRSALAALEKIVSMNRQTASDQYGDADKAESWACVSVARAALALTKGQPE